MTIYNSAEYWIEVSKELNLFFHLNINPFQSELTLIYMQYALFWIRFLFTWKTQYLDF
jgi:hypothetical protein